MKKALGLLLLCLAWLSASAQSFTSGTIGKVSLSPEQGSVSEIESITLRFYDLGWRGLGRFDTSGITLRAESGSTFTVVRTEQDYDEAFCTMFFGSDGVEKTITEAGVYTLTVPEATFIQLNKPDICNATITATYTVDGSNAGEGPAKPSIGSFVTVPADGATVGELDLFSITFTDLPENGVRWPFDISAVTLQRQGDTEVYHGYGAQLSKDNTITAGFAEGEGIPSGSIILRTPGLYTLTIPEGTFAAEADPSATNPEIVTHFTIDPALNFTCSITPASGTVLQEIAEITVAPTDVMASITLAGAASQATLSDGVSTIALRGTDTAAGVTFVPEAQPGTGEWTLTIPAGALSGVTTSGLEIVNAKPFTATYTVKQPQRFSFTTTPVQGATIELFTKLTIDVESTAKKVSINAESGTPMLSGNGVSLELSGSVSSKSVMLAVKGGANLADGTYTITIPAGYIVTTDKDNLTAPMDEITVTFTVEHPEPGSLSSGMLIYNEGWFGHDMASFTHLSVDNTAWYDAFIDVNPTKSLGITGTCATRFADKLYAVSKQSGKNLGGVEGNVLTQLDAASLTYVNAFSPATNSEQGRAFCGATAQKGYLTTSKGIYPIDLASMTAGEPFSDTQSITLAYGDMLRYRGRVFVTAKDWQLMAIDPATDKITDINAGAAVCCFVTPDGSLYAATLDTGSQFMKIDPETLEASRVEIDPGTYEGRICIANVWTTWFPAPLAVDNRENVVYYATASNASTVARLDLDNGEFIPDFITLPEGECLYGKGIAVDPLTDEIVLTTVEKGYGSHYTQNHVYRADPADGRIIPERSVKLSEYYWFPSMVTFCCYEAPEINLSDFTLEEGSASVDLAALTTLKAGNRMMIEYTLESSDPAVCTVTPCGYGEFDISLTAEGTATLTATADYEGMVGTAEITVGTSGISAITANSARCDVYSLTGTLVLRNADQADISRLPAGFYIARGRKILVK
ncbi:MAG: DUF5074 domain-containing protein [Bacteroides sp.]|nr:DUF5074 domain-containing protein [Bacteroides sp.]